MKTITIVASLFVLACSAGGGEGSTEKAPQEEASSTGGAPAKIEDRPVMVTSTGGTEGTEEVSHPLFGAGNYTGVDMSDPCNSAPLWKASTSIPHGQGTIVLYEGRLWKITGQLNDPEASWVRPDCMPPGNPENPADCGAEYQWQELGECPSAN